MYCWNHLDDVVQLNMVKRPSVEEKPSFFGKMKSTLFSHASELNEMAEESEEEWFCCLLLMRRINIFSLASGHLYERFLKIMMRSFSMSASKKVHFWLIENFLSPQFKVLPTSVSDS